MNGTTCRKVFRWILLLRSIEKLLKPTRKKKKLLNKFLTAKSLTLKMLNLRNLVYFKRNVNRS